MASTYHAHLHLVLNSLYNTEMLSKKNILRMKTKVVLLATCAILFSSCEKMLDVKSTHLVSEENMWLKQEDARAGIMGIYGLARAALGDNTRHWLYGDVRRGAGGGGDFLSSSRLDIKAISENKLKSAFPLVQSLANWRRFYAVINAANVFIERAPSITESDPRYQAADLRLDLAHARLLRAFSYFYMVRIWGDVPFIIASHDGSFENKPREDQKKILAFVESELLAVAPNLPYAYFKNNPEQPRSTYYSGEEEIARKSSAYAILAHVYAWQSKYAEAAYWAKWVIDNMAHPMLGGQNQYFNSVNGVRKMFRGEFGNDQFNVIFGFSRMFYNGESFISGSLEELTLAAPYVLNKSTPSIYVSKDSVLSLFKETPDARFSINTLTGSVNTDETFGAFDKTIPVFTKVYIIRDFFPPVNSTTGPGTDGAMASFGSSTVFTRPEDMSLLLAEASVALGDMETARTQLNNRRAARGLSAYNPAVNGSLIDAIFKERQKELIGEGWKWYDYIRYKKFKNNDPVFLELIKNGGIYWPIADDVLKQNPLLTQNSYWINR